MWGEGAGRDRVARFAALALSLALANCASSDKFARKVDPKYGVTTSPRVVELGQSVPKGGGTYRVGKPYQVAGRTYTPEENGDYQAEGLASWYGTDFHGRLTANGEIFDMESVSAAHPTMPLPSYARVTNLANKRSIIVRVNDRGPYHGDRVIDLSHKAAHLLNFRQNGVARVRVEYVGRASLDGSDDRKLMATLRHGEPAPAPIVLASADRKPMVSLAGPARPLRGPVPVPLDRPYSLGEPVAASATDLTSISRQARMERSETLHAASAFASARYDASAGFMSGRGLY